MRKITGVSMLTFVKYGIADDVFLAYVEVNSSQPLIQLRIQLPRRIKELR